ncbi:hypothetical protein EAO73_29455 [Streptomyces sp. col6]|nr:hypothetical protein EAO73_29455 [Streptomyces sp. col6]
MGELTCAVTGSGGVPLPASSRKRGAAPDPAPQTPTGLDSAARMTKPPLPRVCGNGGKIKPLRRLSSGGTGGGAPGNG